MSVFRTGEISSLKKEQVYSEHQSNEKARSYNTEM